MCAHRGFIADVALDDVLVSLSLNIDHRLTHLAVDHRDATRGRGCVGRRQFIWANGRHRHDLMAGRHSTCIKENLNRL